MQASNITSEPVAFLTSIMPPTGQYNYHVGCHVRRPSVTEKKEKIRWNKLQHESGKDFIKIMKIWLNDILEFGEEYSPQEMWHAMQEVCQIKAKEMLGVTRGTRHIEKETWWWNSETREAVNEKKAAFQEWTKFRNGTEAEKKRLHDIYKERSKQAKKIIAQAQAEATKDLYDELENMTSKAAHRTSDAQEVSEGSSYDSTKIYKIAAQRRRNSKQIQSPKFVKDAQGRLLVDDEEICKRWKEYCNELLNTQFPRQHTPQAEPNIQDTPEDFSESEIEQAVKMMKNRKAAGPDDLPAECWKKLGSVGVKFLTVMFNKMMKGAPMPDQWPKSYLIPLYKGKGDTSDCNNYRSIKLMTHSMKIYERAIGIRLRQLIHLKSNQCGFVQGKSTYDAIQSLRLLTEKHREASKDLYMVFVDLEKAFDRVPRDLIWTALRTQNIPETYVKMLQDIYDKSCTSIRCPAGTSEEFEISVGVHQGGVLSPLLFNVTFNYLQEQIDETENGVWEFLFADDAAIVSSNLDALQEQMNKWMNSLEPNGLKISRMKTEFLHCNFSNAQNTTPTIKLGDTVLPKCEKFKYLGSIVNENASCDDDVLHRISVGWMKWRENSGIFCDAKMPLKLKGKLYTTIVRPALTYGTQCWTMYAQYKNKMTAAEMKMCRMSLGVTKMDKIKSERIRGSLHIKKDICT
uniref:CSON007526 protein n=1 Tax=Culicoides sonorensis TaxID=179676 RepID=A0A336LYA8_CULSO